MCTLACETVLYGRHGTKVSLNHRAPWMTYSDESLSGPRTHAWRTEEDDQIAPRCEVVREGQPFVSDELPGGQPDRRLVSSTFSASVSRQSVGKSARYKKVYLIYSPSFTDGSALFSYNHAAPQGHPPAVGQYITTLTSTVYHTGRIAAKTHT